MILTFNKIDDKWYVELPDWKGNFEDLEMIFGADDFLEIYSRKLNSNKLIMEIWLANPNIPCAYISKIAQNREGATYQVHRSLLYKNTVWLCNVTKFVFGGFHPNTIYFKFKI